ncbi:DUF418 domain-containing protein [Bacillus paramycoides]|uniref:DUF418 domain-containing protein n=1 Tax=Bacillus paramycoides TaxID=2026194 RepID=UPI0040588B3D
MRAIEKNERIDVLDILRGFALLGIIFMNIPTLIQMGLPLTIKDTVYAYSLNFFVEGKFFSIFSFLFGVGFYIFLSRAKLKTEHPYLLFTRRLLILALFGAIHMYFQPGEALFIYAVLGFGLMFCSKIPMIWNLVCATVLLGTCLFLGAKVLMPLPFMMFGYAAAHYRIFSMVSQHLRQWWIFTGVMFLLSVGLWVIQYMHLPPLDYFVNNAAKTEGNIANYIFLTDMAHWSIPIVSSFYVGLVCLLAQTKLLVPLKAYGRMALTNYILQTFLILGIGYVLNLKGHLSYLDSFFICVSIHVLLIIFSNIWLKYFRFGPLEWLWRKGTYGKN